MWMWVGMIGSIEAKHDFCLNDFFFGGDMIGSIEVEKNLFPLRWIPPILPIAWNVCRPTFIRCYDTTSYDSIWYDMMSYDDEHIWGWRWSSTYHSFNIMTIRYEFNCIFSPIWFGCHWSRASAWTSSLGRSLSPALSGCSSQDGEQLEKLQNKALCRNVSNRLDNWTKELC